MNHVELKLGVESVTGKRKLAFPMRRLNRAGWVGGNKKALRAYIDELGQHGVPAPPKRRFT
jgi:hypothetical protein